MIAVTLGTMLMLSYLEINHERQVNRLSYHIEESHSTAVT